MGQLAVLAVKAFSALNQGAQDRKLRYQEAEGLRDQRNRHMAATTAKISEREREKEYMYSRALSLSAASGGGVDDPGLITILGDLNAEGEYRILAELYTGSSEAEGIRVQTETAMREGDSALQASYMKAATTVLSEYGNYGDMWGEAKDQYSTAKKWVSNKYGHGMKANRASLGMLDYTKPNYLQGQPA